MNLLEPLFRWEPVERVFSDPARLQAMLDFEAALAVAGGRSGIVPASASATIASKCKAELFDCDALARAAATCGNLAIPLVKQLTKIVAESEPEAARYVHWGATSQDVVDTGLVLQLRAALDLIENELASLAESTATLVQKHRSTIMAGRTWLQQALPITFGFQVAGWLDALDRHRLRIRETRTRSLMLQFGGAVGTLAALGDQGVQVAEALASELKLVQPAMPWHSHRDRIAEIGTTMGLLSGTLGKIARDISLATQTEVGEMSEPAGEGRGGSSTMPHKRNPVACAIVLSAATRIPGLVGTTLSAMIQEQERGLGGWHAEWETVPEIIGLTAGSLHQLADTISGLEVRPEKMRANLDLTNGLIFSEAVQMALAAKMGRMAAHELLERACKRVQAEARPLHEVLKSDVTLKQYLNTNELQRLFEPGEYLGVGQKFIDRVLANHARLFAKPEGLS